MTTCWAARTTTRWTGPRRRRSSRSHRTSGGWPGPTGRSRSGRSGCWPRPASGSSSTWEPGSRRRRAFTRPPARPTRRPAWCTSITTRLCTRTTRRCWLRPTGWLRCRPTSAGPRTILGHPDVARLIDLGEPVVLLCVAVLHLVPDADEPEAIVARYRDRVCPGSHLVLSQFASDSDAGAMAELRAVAAGHPGGDLLPAQAPDPAVLRRVRAAGARPDRCPGLAAGLPGLPPGSGSREEWAGSLDIELEHVTFLP